MERNNSNNVTLARCPHCNALCVNGHDEDNQIFCAKCGMTFLPNSYEEMTEEEYKQMAKDAISKHMRGGWIAYKTYE